MGNRKRGDLGSRENKSAVKSARSRRRNGLAQRNMRLFYRKSVDAQSQYSDADLSGFEQIEKKVLSSKLAAQSAADEAKQYAGKATLSASELSSSVTALNSHIESKSNPHGVTKAQLGLGSVDNMPI